MAPVLGIHNVHHGAGRTVCQFLQGLFFFRNLSLKGTTLKREYPQYWEGGRVNIIESKSQVCPIDKFYALESFQTRS